VDLTPIEQMPCQKCGFTIAEHWYRRLMHYHEFSPEVREQFTDREYDILMKLHTRLKRGHLHPPLPPPGVRRRIRREAGVTQQELADLLCVTRHTISRYEKPAGHLLVGETLPGREPVGEIRREYVKALKEMIRQGS
jgi:hypothetical protein